MQFKDITSTSFGLVIGFLLPGVVALFSLTFWYEPAADAFHTFLTDASNFGLFLFLLLAALVLGLATSSVRWLLYEVLYARLPRAYGPGLTEDEQRRLCEADRFAPYRAAVDETYRYHQFFGGLTIAAPALFAGWLGGLESGYLEKCVLSVGFLALEVLLAASAISAFRSFRRYAKAILAMPPGAGTSANPTTEGSS